MFIQDQKISYKGISGDEIKRILECQLCCGQMSESNHLMCSHCSKTWCAKCFRESLRHDKRCPNCRKAINETKLIKSWLLSELFQTQISGKKVVKIARDICKKHKEQASIMCMDWDEKLCIDWVCMEIHRGHTIKPLKAIFEEAKGSAEEAEKSLEKYSSKIEDSQYSLQVVKII